MKKSSIDILKEIWNLHLSGETILALGNKYGIDDVTLARHLIKHGLKKKPSKKPRVMYKCPICLENFTVFMKSKKRICCSRKCYAKYQSIYCRGKNSPAYKRIQKHCVICNKMFTVMPCHQKTKRTCSKDCLKKWKSLRFGGENNPNYRNGKTPEIIKLRYSSQYVEWRDGVYKRDSWTCQQCGQVGKRLNAHHILSFTKYPKARFDRDNGITLCVPCHQKLHRREESIRKNA